MEDGKKLSLKVDFNEDMRRLTIEDSKYSRLKKEIVERYGLDENSFTIKYKDEEDDLITIASQTDLEEALIHKKENLLRLSIIESKKSEIDNNTNKIHNEEEGIRFAMDGENKFNSFKNWKRNKNLFCQFKKNLKHQLKGDSSFRPLMFLKKLKHMKKQFIESEEFDSLLEKFLDSGLFFEDVEKSYRCNSCNLQLDGKRYNCIQCEQFNFCPKCFEENSDSHDSSHHFEEISPVDFEQPHFENKISIAYKPERIESQDSPSSSSSPFSSIEQPKSNFEKNLEELNKLGFNDKKKNIQALILCKGDLTSAINQLINK